MNKTYGFIHMDLHSSNLLINEETLNFKLFDFDSSSTQKHVNLSSLYKLIYNTIYYRGRKIKIIETKYTI